MKMKLTLLLSLLAISVYAQDSAREIRVQKAFDAVSLTNGQSSTSMAIRLDSWKPVGYFSLQMAVTAGTGSVASVNYELSNDGQTFVTPASASAICSSIATNSGPSSDGNAFYSFAPELSLYIRIKATATNTATFSGWLAIQ